MSVLKPAITLLLAGVLFQISCKKEYSCEGCRDGNKPPIANAGPDQVITLPTDSVSLDGSRSSDPDGTISSFLWTKISGPASFAIINASAARTVIKNLTAGVYKFELKVTDNGGLSAKDTVQVLVDDPAVNQPPVANAGPDQIITLPANSVSLDGSGSTDPDNNIVSYTWAKIAGPSSFNIANANAVQTLVNNLVQDTYQFELKVTDAGALFSKDTMQVIVNAANSNNIPPIARAGNDTVIQSTQVSCNPLPVSITLNGSNSYDPDGTIVSYLWTGPGSISNPNSAITQVSNLSFGTNKFILKVTDNNGASGNNTVSVVIGSLINVQLIPIGTLSQARSHISVGAAGNKIIFAGGYLPNNSTITRVDVYDVASNSWSTAELSQNHRLGGVATLGTKVYFAGGLFTIPVGGGLYDNRESSRIDIYDASTNLWSIAELSSARSRLQGATAGNKILFAGSCFNCVSSCSVINCGEGTGIVDIYDDISATWSTAALSLPRQLGSATTIGNKIYFAGGIINDGNGNLFPCSRIDIYDASSNNWSTSELSQPRGFLGGIAIGTKNYWAGGEDNTVEIKDAITQNQSFACLFQPNRWQYSCSSGAAVQKNNKIVFFTTDEFQQNAANDKFDIYDITTNTWSIGVLPFNIYGSSIISINNTIYVSGGYVNGVLSNQVWKLEF